MSAIHPHCMMSRLKSSASTASVSIEHAYRSYPRPLGVVSIDDFDFPLPEITSSDKFEPSLHGFQIDETESQLPCSIESSSNFFDDYSTSDLPVISTSASAEMSLNYVPDHKADLKIGKPEVHIGHDWGGRDRQRRPYTGLSYFQSAALHQGDKSPLYRAVRSEEVMGTVNFGPVAPRRNFSDYIPPPLWVSPFLLHVEHPPTTASTEGAMNGSLATPATLGAEELLAGMQGPGWKVQKAQLISLRGNAAVELLDSLQSWLDANLEHNERRKLLSLLIELATASNELPRSLFITGVSIESSNPTCFGGCADVFRGTFQGKRIALKRLRINEQGQAREKIHRKFCKEGLIWRQLVHPNILPFLGVDKETFSDIQALCMVSPWMGCATIMEYVRSNGYNPEVDRLRLIIEVAMGLEYLHAQRLAHGDLHGSNVFMTDDGRPCLADFGLTVITDTTFSHGTTTTTDVAGAARWLAPELLIGNKTATRKSLAGDVFAFGRLCLAVCTTRRPFHDTSDISVLFLILQGEHPPRPTGSECGGHPMPDKLWSVVYQCWATKPERRPDISSIILALRMIDDHSSNASLFRPSTFQPNKRPELEPAWAPCVA